MHGALIRPHLDEHVARVEPARHRHALAVLDLHHVLRRDERLLDVLLLRRLPRLLRDPMLDQLLDLVLVPRVGLDRIPANFGRHDHHAKTSMMTSMTVRTPKSMIQMIADTMNTNTRITKVEFLS